MVNNGDRTYVSLHTHSTHSIGDGISTPGDLAKRAAELGMPAMALTDHGRMSGLVSFEKACHEHNVKPIMGMEAYCCGIGRSRTERKNYTMDTRDLAGKPGHEKSCYHLILLAKDETGYDNLCRLTTESYATGFYYKPRIDYELLHEHRDGLIVCSACVLGELSMAVQDDDIDKARRVIDWFRGEFGDDYFVEVQNHGLPMELNAMRTLRELADDSDVRTIVTNDSHYTLKGDAKLQKTVMLINRHKSWADADVRGSFFDDASVDGQRAIEDEHGGEGDSDPIFETSSELYVKSYDEMVEALRPNGGEGGRVERELANTLEIAERCEYEIPFIDPSDTDAYFLPKYDVTTDVRYEEYERSSFAIPDYITKACVKELRDEGHDEVNEISDYLDASDMEALRFLMWLCEDGMHRRVIPKIDAGGNPMPEEMWIRNKPEGMHVIHTHKSPDEQWVRKQVEAGRTRDDMIQEYRDRLAYETGVVVAKRFVNYFLIVQSYVNYVRAQGEMVGPGRGSGAGSLLNYLSGITSVDPIPNDLLFFRFLNKDRKGYPDIDVDFSSHGRDDILWPHLREVYGKDSTAMVAAYTYFWGKAAIKAASRVLFDCSSCRTMTPEQRRAGKDESITLSNALCDLIDNRPHLDLSDELTDETDANGRPLGNEPLKALIKTDRRYQQIIDLALMLQGMISGESQHASAYILSPHPIVDKLPLMVSKDERERSTASGEPVQDYIIQYDGREIQDQLGYVKMDLLCINDLEVITQTIKKIHDAYGVDIDIDNIPFDCKTTFDLLRQGKTAGVFQFDGSPVPKRLITEGKADSLNDLSMINALDRPGSLNMGMDKEFIERKRDKGKIEYFSPDAEDILKDTYGLACVARDSIVMTSEGEKYIQDIHVGDKVLAEDCQWHNVSAWYDKGIRETLRIRTDFGGELVCTPDHKILTSDGWVRADHLSKGMLIKGAMPSDMPHGANVRTIEPFDYKDWLIGLFLADGHSPKLGVPNISCGSRENAERIAEIARTVLPDMQNIHLTMTDGREHGSGVTWHVVFAQTPSGTHNGHFGKQAVQNDMNALLKQYGLFGKVKDEKKWPEKYSFSTIIGIIEGDGTDQAQILTLKHHDLAYSVYKALLEYGIHASIYLRGDKLAWIVSYSDIEHRIRPIARDYSGHDGCNGYYIPCKYLERYHYDMNIPYCVRKRYLGGTKNHMTPGVNIVKVRQHFGWSCHDDEHPTWGKILSVIPDGMHHVYDITVDDNHSFLCNDLFLSNCFQESLMLLSENKNIVGFTPGEADTMRKILAHKDKAKIQGIVNKAHDRAAQNSVPKETVDEFCDMAVASGSYSFNRSHSLAYALIAYRGAFLKTFFPDCFLSSVAQIKPQMKGKDKIPDYLNEARQLGVELRPPHVNWSDIGFSVPEPHVIAYGLERIKGVGAAAQTIVDERHAHGEFTDITDFCCRVPKSVTKTALKALVSAGALDNLGWTRRALEASVGDLAEFRKKWFKEREKNVGQLSLGLDIGTSVSATGDGSDDAGRTVSDVDAFYADGRHHNDHGTILMPPTTEEFPPYQMMEREHEAFGMYFSVTPEDWSQLARLEADEWLEGKRKESARQNREGVEIGGKRYRIINVSDVPSLPDSMRVVFTAMVEDVTPKFGDTRGYRLFKSGKGAMVFLIDWGVGAEGRFGFSPSESRVRLTCFERVWNGMPKPSPNAVVLVWGRVNVSDKFPTSVIADGVRTLQYDAVRFQGRKERADELMGRLRDIAARASDPSSVAYLIPRVSLPDRNAYDRFVADHVMHAKYDDLYGMAIVTYDGCADDDSDRVMRLAQTVGMVRYARDKYGATVTKVRLPMAESELARRF